MSKLTDELAELQRRFDRSNATVHAAWKRYADAVAKSADHPEAKEALAALMSALKDAGYIRDLILSRSPDDEAPRVKPSPTRLFSF